MALGAQLPNPPAGVDPEALTREPPGTKVRTETERWAKVVKTAGGESAVSGASAPSFRLRQPGAPRPAREHFGQKIQHRRHMRGAFASGRIHRVELGPVDLARVA